MTELHRIHGCPGAGKTTKIAAWAQVACDKFGPEAVVLCSLTRAAAHEIRSRGLPVPDENVGTLHALCYRLLGGPDLHVEKIDDWNSRWPAYALSGGATDADDLGDGPRGETPGDELEQTLSLYRARRIDPRMWPSEVRNFSGRWSAWKDDAGVLDFGDLLEETLARDLGPPVGAEVIFYDEAQDGSRMEHDIVRRWAEGCSYGVIAGDVDQSCFRWRGGDPDVFLAPLPIGPGAEHPLGRSFRCPEAVRAIALPWIRQSSRRFPLEWTARVDRDGRTVEGAAHRSDVSLRSDAIADLALSELDWLDHHGEVTRGTVMVLATCGYLLAPALAVLRKAGIPFHCPYRRRRGDWTPMRGAVDRLAAMLVPVRTRTAGAPRLWTVVELWTWVEHLRADGLVRRGMKTVLEAAARDARKARDRTPLSLGEVNAYLHGDPLRELGAILSAGDVRGVGRWARARVAARYDRPWSYALAVLDRGGIDALTGDPRVVVGTCHATKGGEASSVLLSTDVSPAAARSWVRGGEDQDDVRRPIYVGMTRARERLTILQSAVGWPCAIPV